MAAAITLQYRGKDIQFEKSDQLVAVRARAGMNKRMHEDLESIAPGTLQMQARLIGSFEVVNLTPSENDIDQDLDWLRSRPSVAAASHVFQEGRLLVDAARKNRRIVQHGTQMRSNPVTAEAAEVLKSGILGEIKITKAWNVQDRGFAKPVEDSDPPAGVDYNRWLGPAKKRPFNRNRFHRTWRLFREYGNGDFGDDGAHGNRTRRKDPADWHFADASGSEFHTGGESMTHTALSPPRREQIALRPGSTFGQTDGFDLHRAIAES